MLNSFSRLNLIFDFFFLIYFYRNRFLSIFIFLKRFIKEIRVILMSFIIKKKEI